MNSRWLVSGSLATAVLLAVVAAAALSLRGPAPARPAQNDARPAPSFTVEPQPNVPAPSSAPPGSLSSSAPAVSVSRGTSPASATQDLRIPPDAMLAPGDLGPDVRGNEEHADDGGSLAMMLAACDQSPPSWQKRVYSAGFRQRWLYLGDGQFAVQELSRQPHPVAEGLIGDLVAAFRGPCATVVGGNPAFASTFTIRPSAWGQQSLLMRETRSGTGPAVAWRIAIRQGDLFTEIHTSIDGFTEEQARELGRRAAQRLCSATPTC